MRICFICHTVDQEDPINAALVRWIDVLASKPQVEQVVVIPLDQGKHPFIKRFRPPIGSKSKVFVNPPIRGRNRLETILNFYRDAWFWSAKRFTRGYKPGPIDCFFLWGGGVYPLLLLPFRFLLRKPLYHWKAHRYINPLQRFYIRCCDTKVFTSMPSALPLKGKKIKVVGQGIDIRHFKPMPEIEKTGELITVGRVSRSKRIHVMIEALRRCNEKYGTDYTLDIYGPENLVPEDGDYRLILEDMVLSSDMEGHIGFRGPVLRKDLPRILNKHKVYLNFSYDKSALDRACVEAMACGLPVISCNPCVAETLEDYQLLRDSAVMVPPQDIEKQADRIKFWLGSSKVHPTFLQDIACVFRDVAEQHSDEALWDKILTEMKGEQP